MSNLQSIILCELCGKREAGSQESHIIPKFFTKSIYFENGVNQGMKTIKFVKRVMGEIENNWKQDSLKQKHLFCGNCEKYLELLDTHFCNKIYAHLRNPKEINNYFKIIKLKHTIAFCEIANENIVGLFLLSVFLRCHVSSLPFCKNLQLSTTEYSYVKNILNKYYCLKQTDLQQQTIPTSLANLFSYLIFTYANNSKINTNQNFLDCNYTSNEGIYYLVINDFVFTLYLQKSPFSFYETLNTNNEKVKITMLTDKEFNISRTANFNKYIEENFFSNSSLKT